MGLSEPLKAAGSSGQHEGRGWGLHGPGGGAARWGMPAGVQGLGEGLRGPGG